MFRSSIKILFFSLIVGISLTFAFEKYSLNILSLFIDNDKLIEKAIVDDKAFVYYKGSEDKKAIRTFDFFEQNVLESLKQLEPSLVMIYESLKEQAYTNNDPLKYGFANSSYGAVYFNKLHFFDIGFIALGEFKADLIISETEKFLNKAPSDIKFEKLENSKFKLTFNNPKPDQRLPVRDFTIVFSISNDKIVMANDVFFDEFLEKINKPNLKNESVFSNTPNLVSEIVLDVKNSLNSYGFLLSGLNTTKPEIANELNKLETISHIITFDENEPKYIGNIFLLKTSNPSFYKKHFDLLIEHSKVMTPDEYKLLVNHFLNKVEQKVSKDTYANILKLDKESIQLLTKEIYIKYLEHQRKMEEMQQKQMERMLDPNSNGFNNNSSPDMKEYNEKFEFNNSPEQEFKPR